MIHPDYLLIADEIKTKQSNATSLFFEQENNFENEWLLINRILKYRNRTTYFTWAFFLVFILVLSIGITYHYNNRINTQLIPKIKETESKIEFLKQTSNLTSNVLNELVSTVDQFLKNSKSSHIIKNEPFKVKAKIANLREFPSLNSNIIATVQKDIDLFGSEINNGWIKTFAPNGKEAWIHESLISKANF